MQRRRDRAQRWPACASGATTDGARAADERPHAHRVGPAEWEQAALRHAWRASPSATPRGRSCSSREPRRRRDAHRRAGVAAAASRRGDGAPRLRGGDRARRCAAPRAQAPASVVMPLLLPDLPVFLRWRGRPPFGDRAFEQLVDLVDRLIVDSREWPDAARGYGELARHFERRGRSDIAWARTGRGARRSPRSGPGSPRRRARVEGRSRGAAARRLAALAARARGGAASRTGTR